MTATAQILPFQFDTQEVRTLLIDDQPWFFAIDVCNALELRDTNKALIGLDDDEKREHEQYSGSGRKPVLINESGLYSLILRSRKAEAKRFKKWVTAEVLPAIRQHGRYDIATATIGTDGLHILHELIGKKIHVLPGATKRQARAKLWSLVHTRFNVPRAEMIPAAELESACNFIAACALDGQWLPAPANDDTLTRPIRSTSTPCVATCCACTNSTGSTTCASCSNTSSHRSAPASTATSPKAPPSPAAISPD